MFICHLRDGSTVTEGEVSWKEIPHKDITSLQLLKDKQLCTVSVDGSNVQLIQLKRNLMDLLNGTDDCTERVIGFIVDDTYAVKLAVNEAYGSVMLTLEKKVKNEKGKDVWRRL